MTRRKFTPEAVALLETGGRPKLQIAAELGLPLHAEAAAYGSDGRLPTTADSGITGSHACARGSFAPDQAVAVARLRRERDRTGMNRDVLSKAIGI